MAGFSADAHFRGHRPTLEGRFHDRIDGGILVDLLPKPPVHRTESQFARGEFQTRTEKALPAQCKVGELHRAVTQMQSHPFVARAYAILVEGLPEVALPLAQHQGKGDLQVIDAHVHPGRQAPRERGHTRIIQIAAVKARIGRKTAGQLEPILLTHLFQVLSPRCGGAHAKHQGDGNTV